MNELEKIQKKLIELSDRWFEITQHGKVGEPSLTITIHNDMTYSAEIYSYQMDFHDGGRHHYFEAETFDKLIKILWAAVKKEEKKLKEEIIDEYSNLEEVEE